MIYETMLLFGVVFMLFLVALLLSSTLLKTQTPSLHIALQYLLILSAGIYFVWLWSHGGQTLAMKTWRIRLVNVDGQAVTMGRATYRYFLAWLWILPGLALAWALHVTHWMLIFIPLANMLAWALTIYLDPHRQFLHDRLAGTRLVSLDK